jgi:hypothetical protein
VNIKSLALKVLEAAKDVPSWYPGKTIDGTKTECEAPSSATTSSLPPCGSPHCAGCYEVEDGKRIHPPK